MTTAPLLFPGQLSEFSGMGKDFYDTDPEARALFVQTSHRCDRDLERILFSGSPEELHENLAAQAGVYLVSTLACRALAREGIWPAATAGYSLGNYAAFVAARALSYEEGLDVLIAVWRETERLGIHGAMGAVIGCRWETVEQICGQLREAGLPVWIGNVNASTQFVLTGTVEAVQSALDTLAPRALSVLALPMTWPIHSELMEPVAIAVAPVVDRLCSITDPAVPFYGPDGGVVRRAEQIRQLLATEFVHPTLWNATFEAMIADGFRTFAEVGPGEMLARMARWIDRSATCLPAGSLQAIRHSADILHAP